MNNKLKKLFNVYNIIFIVIMALFLIWGLLAFRDYGISWDEEIQRYKGLAGLRTFISMTAGEENVPEALNAEAIVKRQPGNFGIKLPVVIAEYVTGFKLTNGQVFRMHHLYYFLLFFVSAIFMWILLKQLGFSELLSLCGLVLYITCPRILADAFYNNKDLAFLSVYVIIIALGTALVKDYKKRTAILLGVVCAVGYSVRSIAPFPAGILALYYILKESDGKNIKSYLKPVVRVIAVLAVMMITYCIITPRAWTNVFGTIVSRAKVLVSVEHGGFDLIAGHLFNRLDLPWYYLPFTIVLTVPCIYIIFGIAGMINSFIKSAGKMIAEKSAEAVSENELLIFLLLLQMAAFVGYTIVFKPMQYNYWRHFYFLFVYIVIFTVYGIRAAMEKSSLLKVIAVAFTVISVSLTIRWIGVNHPYEYLYFNPLFNDDVARKSDQDYWKVSYQGLLNQIIDGSATDVYLFPTLTGNQLFGEAGYENYHLEALKNSAKYRIEDAYPGENAVYKILKTVEVDGRIAQSLIRRVNYGNVLRRYYFENDRITGVNYDDEIEWAYEQDGTKRSVTAHIPDSISVKEIDFLYDAAYAAAGLRAEEEDTEADEEAEPAVLREADAIMQNRVAYVSDDGINYRRMSDECIFDESDTFAVTGAADGYLPSYVKICFEDVYSEDELGFSIRVYGDEEGKNKADVYYNRYEASALIENIYSSENADDLREVIDGRDTTAYTFKNAMKGGEYIEFDMNEAAPVLRGIHIDTGATPANAARGIVIEGIRGDGVAEQLDWYYGAADDYLFVQPGEYVQYRIKQTGKSDKCWSVAEIGLIK